MILKISTQLGNQVGCELACVEVSHANLVQVMKAVAVIKQKTTLSCAIRLVGSVTHILTTITFVCGDQVSSAVHLVSVEAIGHVGTENRPAFEINTTILIAGVNFITRKSVIFKTNTQYGHHFRGCEIDNSHRIIFLKCCESRSSVL